MIETPPTCSHCWLKLLGISSHWPLEAEGSESESEIMLLRLAPLHRDLLLLITRYYYRRHLLFSLDPTSTTYNIALVIVMDSDTVTASVYYVLRLRPAIPTCLIHQETIPQGQEILRVLAFYHCSDEPRILERIADCVSNACEVMQMGVS